MEIDNDKSKKAVSPIEERKRNESVVDDQKSKRIKKDDDVLFDFNSHGQFNMKIDQLPKEVFVKIINFLPVIEWPILEKVNHYFQRAVLDSWLVLKKIVMDQDFRMLRKDYRIALMSVVEKLVHRAPNLVHLIGFSTFKCVLFDYEVRLLARLANLQSIDFGKCTMLLQVFGIFLERSASRSRLKELKAENVYVQPTYQGPDILQGFLAYNTALHEAVQNLPKCSLVSLESLDLSGCTIVIDFVLLAIIEQSPRLRRINLQGTKVCEFSLRAIAWTCPDLRELDLSRCTRIYFEGVQAIVDECTQLERLKMTGHEKWFPRLINFEKNTKLNFA